MAVTMFEPLVAVFVMVTMVMFVTLATMTPALAPAMFSGRPPVVAMVALALALLVIAVPATATEIGPL